MRRWMVACVAGALALAGGAVAASAERATAQLVDAKGKALGTARLEQTPNGVLVKAELSNLPPGELGFHIHDKGACQPPFQSAGGHFNPERSAHGFAAKQGPHAGDLPNLHVGEDGRVRLDYFAEGLRLGGPDGVLGGDGAAIVVHAGADDYRTDPAGDSGARIACGVIRKAG